MTAEIPDAAIEAAAEALGHDDDCTQVTLEIGCNCDLDDRTRAAIEAAMPAIGEHFAQKIEAVLEPDGTGEGWDTAIGRCLDILRGDDE